MSARSYCPNCKTTIPFYDLIPLLSYIILLGKCRKCSARISIRYPIVEALTAAFLLLLVYLYGFSAEAAANFVFLSILIIVSFIDIENLLIPDFLLLLGIMVGLGYRFLAGQGLAFSAIGIAIGFVFMYFLSVSGKVLFKKEALGEGDIKLAVMLGAFLGWEKLILAIFLASTIGLFIVLFLLAFKRIKREDYLPFGSFLSLGAFISLLYGNEILGWFLDFK